MILSRNFVKDYIDLDDSLDIKTRRGYDKSWK